MHHQPDGDVVEDRRDGGRDDDLPVGDAEELGDEDSTREDEAAANEFARETLLPSRDMDDWLRRTSIDRGAIQEFATNQGVAPGIVVGRLQREGRIPKARFNDLKRRVGTWG